MKKLISLMFVLIANYLPAQTPINDAHWDIIWQDEFNDNSINPIWTVGHYMMPKGKCIIMEDNVRENNGNLIITTKKEEVYCPVLNSGFVYTAAGRCDTAVWYPTQSGWVETDPDFISFQYGYIEARINFPQGVNYHNGFWTFYADGNTNINAGEIDIVESTHNVVNTNSHTCYTKCYPTPMDTITCLWCYTGSFDLPVASHTNSFHKFGVSWSPDNIVWYFDDAAYRIKYNSGLLLNYYVVNKLF